MHSAATRKFKVTSWEYR